MRQRVQRDGKMSGVSVYMGKKLIRMEFVKSLSKVTLWSRKKEESLAADTLEEAGTIRFFFKYTIGMNLEC